MNVMNMSIGMTAPATPEPLNMEVSKTLNKIIKNATKKDVEIKEKAQKALDLIREFPMKDPEVETQSAGYEQHINTLVTPLLQTCDPQNKLIKPAIAVLQRLVTSGFVRVTQPHLETGAPSMLRASSGGDLPRDAHPKQLIEKIVERACKCTESDESTQIAVVKLLETCCTTPTVNVHGSTLLAAVKCCFQLFILSKPKTQLFAAVKKSITDIINYLFQRIRTTKKHVRNSLSIGNMNELLQHQLQMLQQEQTQSQLAVKIEKHDGRPDDIRIVSDILNDIIDSVVGSDVAISGPGKVGIIVEDITFSDFCMIFVYVCQVSAELPKSDVLLIINTCSNVREVPHGKLLALQILHTMISNSATTLRSSKKFVYEILREHLVPALILNAGATGKVFQYVLSIFVDLLQYFREYLMSELGSFFVKSLLLRMEGSTATQELYWILTIFSTICKDGHVLLDLFVNYDCDPDQENVFQRCVEVLCKATCHPMLSGQRFISSQHYSDFQIRSVGLKSIVQLTKTLGDWRDSEKGLQTLAHVTEMRERKKKVEHARNIFTESAKKGIELFVALGATTKDPLELGRFLRTYRGLDKTQIGDFISRKENPAILESYVDTFDFSGMEFDLALRLPGESMLIERLVQQFANKYYADNKNSFFANSDAAFVLAYSTIMLATDQHNLNVKVRMTFTQWAKNNSKINDGKDFDEVYLQGIFERISKTPLKLNDNTPTPASADDVPKQQHAVHYTTCYRQALVKYMMEATWQYLVDALDFFMTNCDENSIIEVCMTGYHNAVHISGIFDIGQARAKFLESVIKFAKIDNVREISRKEVESIRALVVIFLFEGDHLGVDWVQVLRCLSYLALLFKLGTVHEIIDPVIEPHVLQTQKNELASLKQNRQLPELPKETISFDATNVAAMTKQISMNSTLLPEDQLILFVEALCKVSHDEIFAGNVPNVFGLQMIADVAYFNLCTRSGAVWSRVWLLISTSHFIKVGTSEHSLAIRKGALDAMEYLLSHFFAKDPLEVNEMFYKDLFFPFDRIIRLCNDHTTRSLILQYVAQLVGNNCGKIRTGWKTIFSVYTWSANCNEVLVEMGLATVEDILREYFQHFATSFFVEFVNCVSAFANSKLPNISIRAIDGISACAVHLANGRVYPPTPFPREPSLKGSDQSTTQLMFTDEQEHLVLWIPVLTALSDVLSSHDLHTVRLCSLDTLERVLVLFGSMFSPKLWEMLFRGVLLPIFNNIGYSKGRIRFPQESQDWLSTTCPHAFRLLMDVFTNFVDTIDFLSGEILQLIASCILQFDSEELLRLGAQSLLRFTTTNGSRFSSEVWDLVTAKIDNIISQITVEQNEFLQSLSPNIASASPPVNLRQSLLLKSPPSPLRQSGALPAPLSSQSNSTPSPVEMRNRHINLSMSSNVLLPPVATRPKLESHVVALQLMVQIIESIATSQEAYSNMSAQHLRSLAEGLEAAYTFCHAMLARMVNEKLALESETVETLDSTELLACSCYLKILFTLYTSKDIGNDEVEQLLLRRCYMFFSNYLRKERINTRLIVQLLTELRNINEAQFVKHLGIFYEVLVQLMLDESEDIRRALQAVWQRIGTIKGGIRSSMNLKASVPHLPVR